MIKFRQKEFVAPLIAAAGRAAMSMAPDLLNAGASAIQNNQQNKIQQEALENQKKQQDQQNKLLNKIAKKDPMAAANAMTTMQQQPQQQQFSKLGNWARGLGKKYKTEAINSYNDIKNGIKGIGVEDFKGFKKDVGHAGYKNREGIALNILGTAAAIGGSYLGNKAVKLYKDHQGKKQLEKLEEEREYSVAEDAFNFGKRGIKFLGRTANKHKFGLAKGALMTAGMTALPFAIQEELKKSMAKDTSAEDVEEREYSATRYVKYKMIKGYRGAKQSYKNLKGGIKNSYENFKSDPLKSAIKFKSGVSSEKISSISNDLTEGGSGSKITKLISDTVKKHPKTSLLIGAGIAYGGKKLSDKAVNTVQKGIKKIDKSAFSQESKYDNLEEE